MEKREAFSSEEISENKNFKKFVAKEMLDKIGFGFSSQQFINVLLFLSGANIFLVGIVNGLKAVLSILLSIFAQEYNKYKGISKRVIGFAGIFFGFSFLFMAMGRFVQSPFVFSIALLLGSLSVVIYGNFSPSLFFVGRKKEALERIAKYGLIVTAVSLFLSAFILDRYTEDKFLLFSILGKTFVIILPGYFIAFEVAAISFIISGYFLSSVKDRSMPSEQPFPLHLLFSNLRQKSREILGNKFLLMLMVFNIIAGLVQIVGNSYYGIFIYETHKGSYFGGFLNIAIVFLIGVFSSLIGYFITKINVKSYGAISMLAIGTLFLAVMPFAYYIGTNLGWLTAGTIFGVIGASALGISTSMLVIETLQEQNRGYYYTLSGLFSIMPYVVFVPVLSFTAKEFGLSTLFLFLGIILVASAIFILVSYKLANKAITKS